MNEETKRPPLGPIAALMQRLMQKRYPREKMQEPKRQTRYTYNQGPMYFLGQQIVKAMQDAGYPAKIIECYRPPERQDQLKAKGRSKAARWHSPHQYYEAVDIVHPTKYWDVTPDYWDKLAVCVRIVADKFGVDLEHGHYWRFTDSAHIEVKSWRDVRSRRCALKAVEGRMRAPDEHDLWARFHELLPDIARRQDAMAKGPKSRLDLDFLGL